jgi:hypothetical protein
MNKIRIELLQTLTARLRPLSIKNELFTLEYPSDEINEYLSYRIPEDENDPETIQWRKIFAIWDNAEGKWTEDTLPRSKERRSLILQKLDIDGSVLCDSLTNSIPLNEPAIGPAIITSDKEHEDWVQGILFHEFGYWERYKNYLLKTKGWDEKAVNSVNISSTRILNYLNNPSGTDITRTKGLVVGYVQSGKTANYSALIAKAIDVGYRMIIVLSGRTDILRNQTQARLDMEIMGWDSLDAEEQEYYSKKSLKENQNYREKFITGEIKPPSQHLFRLTKAQKDFNSGSIALALKDTSVPCIAVLKKIPGRLHNFATILGSSDWKDKPILIIDDEADDASVNTSKNSITVTPSLIAEIMNASNASQYIGYTATPYANVFIRPDKVEELFPSDFVICLDRPEHYMGALEFFDIGDCEPQETGKDESIGNEKSHIRIFEEAFDDIWEGPPKLDTAIDSFMLAGGIKLWRSQNLGGKYSHHTMLINTDVLTDKHSDIAREVESSIQKLYPGDKLDKEAIKRIRDLWENDFIPICKLQAGYNSIPVSWATLEPYVNEAIKRVINEGIRIVNHKNNDDTPDFDVPGGFWGILVGGSKLSRGYTIEGLTTTYFSRKPGQLDTLVQMARWYGFRKGYQDLVRLFMPQYLPRGKSKSGNTKKEKGKRYHLLEAFRFGAMVEESFRKNLSEYSKTLKPENIPPLVQYEFEEIPEKFSYLKPTAQNKKRHAKFITTSLGGVIRTVTRIGGVSSRSHNAAQLCKYLDTCNEGLEERILKFSNSEPTTALLGISTSKDYLVFLNSLYYNDKDKKYRPKVVTEQITALEEMANIPWRIIMYKRQKDPGEIIQLSNHQIPHWTRNYDLSEGVLIYDKPLDPGHRQISAWIAHHQDGDILSTIDVNTTEIRDDKCGVTYLVPFTRENDDVNNFYFLWCAVYPGKGSTGAYQVIYGVNQLT